MAESYAVRYDIEVESTIDSDLGDYPTEVQQCVYRIAQEALANIANHAQAQHSQVLLKKEYGQLRLIICDDGCGFDTTLPTEESHYGLLGMLERSAIIGGSMAVESQIGKGTQISFTYGNNS